ncbi:hypothetical protein ABZS66_29080 [Dactylosporangium sp. NPDC005572]|uniref:hypothetical protein n=1 Tax=Dactylosporangium sp. NPDC005572 TaxID=3156889 RepID=UPI0033A9E527
MTDGQPVIDAVAAALAPFDMAEDPGGRWDRWRINGGSVARALPVRAGGEDDPRILRVSAPPEQWVPGRCDGAPRGLLDFAPDRAVARAHAEAEWAGWHAFARRYPAARPVPEFLDRHGAHRGGDAFRAAQRDFMSQPVIRAYMTEHGLDPDRFLWHAFNDPVTVFGDDQVEYVRNRVARAIPTDELLRLDGVWLDYGDFSTGQFDEAAHDRYYRTADAYLDTLPDTAYVVRLRIHC